MPRVLVLGLCAGYFLVLLDVTVVNVALPQINSDLQAGQSGMAGVVNAYTFVLATLPALLPLPFFGAVSARISSRLGVWKTSAAGLIVAGVGLGLMGLMVSGPRLWALSFALVVWAIGVGIVMPAIVAAAMQALPRRPGFASGTGSTARNLGGALGVAVFAALHEVDRGVLMAGVGVAMAAAALLCLRVQRTQFSKVHFASVGSEGSGHSGSG